MRTPRIAVTGMWSSQIHGLRFDGNAASAAVLRSVVRAGGEPVTLFAESPMRATERLRDYDGLLIPGGADLDPRGYGQQPLDTTQMADHPGQDDFEAQLLEAARDLGLPVLAICRGFQLANVQYGGTLQQDLPPDSVHRNSVHEIAVQPHSALAAAIGVTQLTVSSYHHQAVDRVGAGLTVTATAPDGTVEGLEDAAVPLLAVQWHPEDTAESDESQQHLFEWVVREARLRMKRPVALDAM